jgi:hypothetical protein
VTRDLPGILIRELAMNVDYSARLRDNVAMGLLRLPVSLMTYISHKYDVPFAELDACHDQLIAHVLSAAGPRADAPAKKRLVVVHRRRAATSTGNRAINNNGPSEMIGLKQKNQSNEG